MPGPLIPYVVLPEIPLPFVRYIPLIGETLDPDHSLALKPFGVLIGVAALAGWGLAKRRARQRGLDTEKLDTAMQWSVGTGFVFAHLVTALAYHSDKVWDDPWYLLRIWDGMSSFGGLIGGAFGAWIWSKLSKEAVLEFLDVCVSAFPFTWVIGRSACAVVHDHPGTLSNAWFAVTFPPETLQAGYAGRLDLGLIEMALTIPLAIACSILWRRKPRRPTGFYIGLTLTAYAPVRFLLDGYRVKPDDPFFSDIADTRYSSLTPAQWISIGALALGLYFLWRVSGQGYVATAPLAPSEHEADEPFDDAAPPQ